MQVCFANISVTKAQIFMKFYALVNQYLVSLDFKFHEDLCINVHALVVNARVLITRCAHVYDLCMLICARTFMKFETFKLVNVFLMF